MDQEMLRRHLEQATRHTASAEEHVQRQRDLVARMERGGHNTTQARQLLTQFKELEEMHRLDRDRLRKQLGEPA